MCARFIESLISSAIFLNIFVQKSAKQIQKKTQSFSFDFPVKMSIENLRSFMSMTRDIHSDIIIHTNDGGTILGNRLMMILACTFFNILLNG